MTTQVCEMCTSDELCWRLLLLRPLWKVGLVRSNIRCDVPDLLQMQVVAFEPFISEGVASRSRREKPQAPIIPAELEVDDPFGHGIPAGGFAQPSSFAEIEVQALADLDPDDLCDNLLEVAGEDGWDAMPALDEEAVELAEADFQGAPAASVADAAVSSEVAAAPVDGAGDGPDLQGQLAALEGGLAQATSPPSIDVVIREAAIDSNGYVRTEYLPWNAKRPTGRLTSWPKDRPLAKRSFSMRCYLRKNCSFAKSGSVLSEENFIRWLFSADVPEDDAGRQEGGVWHMTLGRSGGFLPGGWKSGLGPSSSIRGVAPASGSASEAPAA